MKEQGMPLPAPDEAAGAHGERLLQLIRQEITATGSISFARFMELALYAPGLGYYSAGRRQFGPGGDFVTAPELSPLFSRCLARQCAQVLAGLGGGCILEFGAGSGIMAAALLEALQDTDALPERYLILEPGAELRARQQALLHQRLPDFMDRIQWLDRLPVAG
ncbi:MAG: SAM-dependent methyltransferase, partial [Gammaproteobacteria bacterium]